MDVNTPDVEKPDIPGIIQQLAFEPGKTYLLIVDPAVIDLETFCREGTLPENCEVFLIPAKRRADAWPVLCIESIEGIERWLVEVKAQLDGQAV